MLSRTAGSAHQAPRRRARTDGSLAKAALAATSPADILLQPIFNPVGGYASYIVPAAFVLILQQTLLIGAAMLTGAALAQAGVRAEQPVNTSVHFLNGLDYLYNAEGRLPGLLGLARPVRGRQGGAIRRVPANWRHRAGVRAAFGGSWKATLPCLPSRARPHHAAPGNRRSPRHIDHVGGLADARGRRCFPNATIWISKADYDFIRLSQQTSMLGVEL
jgi:hypothetical protein